MKILTIAIPVYNTEKYIRRCVDSLLVNEIQNDIEVILVNDGSKDNSIRILNEYKEKYPETIVVIDKENGGHGSTINAALEKATGKYFRVLDSDDWFDSKNFSEFVKKLYEEDVDVIVTNYKKEFVYNGESESIEWKHLKENKVYDFNKFDLKDLDKDYFVMANSTYKTEVLRNSKLKLMEKTFYVDMQFNTIPIKNIKTFKFMDLDIYRYYIGRPEQSMNLQNFVKNRANHEKVMKFLIEYYNSNLKEFSDNQEKYIKQIIFYMLTTHYYIYCYYGKTEKNKLYKEVKNFDKYLKNANSELYSMMNKIGIIRYNRKTNFKFVKINPYLFSKIINRCGRLVKGKEE